MSSGALHATTRESVCCNHRCCTSQLRPNTTKEINKYLKLKFSPTWHPNATSTFHPSFLLYPYLTYIAEKAMAPHSSTLAWKIPWTEELGRLQSMGSRRVGHDWVTSLSLFTFVHWRRKCNPLQYSCLENPRDRGAWWAAVYGDAQSLTRLKCLSSSSYIGYTATAA